MIEKLLKGSDCKVIKTDERIEIFPRSEPYPEDCIAIEEETLAGLFTVYEVHRDEKQIKATTMKEDEAYLYAAISYKRFVEVDIDRTKTQEIRRLISLEKPKEALSFVVSDFHPLIYSIGCEEQSKISLIETADKMNVKYNGKYILENASLKQGYVAFYNYCKKMQHIVAFCDEIQKSFKLDINRENAIMLYIFGKL